jgi:hypothetical protein
VAIAFGASVIAVVAGTVLCALKGTGIKRETVVRAITGVIFCALFSWPGLLRGV